MATLIADRYAAFRRVAPCPRCLTGSILVGSCMACGHEPAAPPEPLPYLKRRSPWYRKIRL